MISKFPHSSLQLRVGVELDAVFIALTLSFSPPLATVYTPPLPLSILLPPAFWLGRRRLSSLVLAPLR